jgi:hypothetical protein
MRWEGHVERMGEMGNAYKVLVKNLKERDSKEVLREGERIILEWILGRKGRMWTG